MTASFKSPRAANEQEHRAADMRLIVMDIDSTLINEEVIDLLGEEAGVGEQVATITERAMRDEIDFRQALEERVGLLAGLGQEVFDRTFERVTFTPGALDLVRAAHARGWKVGVVSGGFHEVADCIVEAAGIDYCLANRLEVVDGKLMESLRQISSRVSASSKPSAHGHTSSAFPCPKRSPWATEPTISL